MVALAVYVVNELLDFIFEDTDELEGEFVKRLLSEMSNSYPDYNILIFHNQDSSFDFSPPYYHEHYELPLKEVFGIETTKGYELWLVSDGWFQLAGDGGWQNWGFNGCYVRDDTYLEFYSQDTAGCS